MGHGSIEIEEEPVDHTREHLRRASDSSARLAQFAADNLTAAKRNVELAEIALSGATARACAAADEYRAYCRA